MEKTALREQAMRMRGTLPPKFVADAAMTSGGFIASLKVFGDAQIIMMYCDFQKETGTRPLLSFCLKKNKKIVLPLTDENFCIQPYYIENEEQLVRSKLGILEPDPTRCRPCLPADIDLLIAPGLAFDISGGRVGYGKGCYDRFLPQLRPEVPIIGLAYDFQVFPSVPSDPHDRLMDAIITEKGFLPVAKARNPVT